MLRVLLSSPTRLAFRGDLRSFSVLRVAPTAPTARLGTRPLVSSFDRLVSFASLRTLSTVATPMASAAITSFDAVSPKGAAELRSLTVDQVVSFVKELHVSHVQAEKLAVQEVDGAALLETSVDELCDRYKLSGGAAHTIMRSIAPAVAEARAAAALAAVEAQSVATLAADEAQSVTLTIPAEEEEVGPNSNSQAEVDARRVFADV
jgi:hypothetical protein